MKTVAIKDAGQLDALLGEDEEVIVTRDGRPIALVIPMDEEELHFYAIERTPGFIDSISRARQQIRDGAGLDEDALKKELGLD